MSNYQWRGTMKFNQFLKTVCAILVLFGAIHSQHKEVKYGSLKGVIKKSLPTGGFAVKDSVVLTKEQANAVNAIYSDAGYKKNKKIIINVLKNMDSTVCGYVVRVKLVLFEFESLHDYAIVFAADKKTLTMVEILQLNDEYAEKLKNGDLFLKQFKNVKDPDSLKLGKNIDAVTEATISSDLTISAVKIVKYILSLGKS